MRRAIAVGLAGLAALVAAGALRSCGEGDAPVEHSMAGAESPGAPPRLRVRLFDPDGGAWSGVTPLRDPARTNRFGEAWRWPGRVAILVLPARRTEFGAVPSGPPLEPTVREDGDCEFFAERAGLFLVGAIGADHRGYSFPGEFVEAAVPERGVALVELRSERGGELGTLAVSVRGGEHDELLGPGFLESGARARLLDPRTGVELLVLDRRARPPFELHAPAGRYRVVAEGAPTIGSHGVLDASREFGRAAAEVTIVAGRKSNVVLHLPGCARLEVGLSGTPRPEDLDAARSNGFGRPAGPFDPERRGTVYVAALDLLAPGEPLEPVWFSIDDSMALGDGSVRLTRGLALGDRHLAEPLPPGRYTLVARLRSGRETRAEILLIEGETTPVTLRFPD